LKNHLDDPPQVNNRQSSQFDLLVNLIAAVAYSAVAAGFTASNRNMLTSALAISAGPGLVWQKHDAGDRPAPNLLLTGL
jgi:hypothetical protein